MAFAKTGLSLKKTYRIKEAGVAFDLPDTWKVTGRNGKLESGKVQYVFSHEEVAGDGRMVNPQITVSIDKASWFTDESNYLEEKRSFHSIMGDSFEEEYIPDDDRNPVEDAYYAKGWSGQINNPYGQLLITITFWNKAAGFHMEIQTSEKDFEKNQRQYMGIVKSVKKVKSL